jgi:hypothetical protein
MALTFARGSRAVAHATVCGAVHGAFMTLPPYTRIREGEVHELGLGVSEQLLSQSSISPRGSLTPER